MSTVVKKKKSEAEFDRAFDAAIDKAMTAKPQDVKIHITCRLDSDIYMELKRRAASGEGSGRYQTLMNNLLRQSLFENDDTTPEIVGLGKGIRLVNADEVIKAIQGLSGRGTRMPLAFGDHKAATNPRPATTKKRVR